VAATYAELRPGYPEAAVRWCAATAGRDIESLRVIDLGAGTGKLTALLAGLGADVTAVDPDPAMLGELRRALPSVRALAGSAERIPLPDASADAVLCGQSMHWFDMPRALPEIARVLAPGGALGALWNNDDDRVPWVAGLQEVAEGASWPSLSRRRREAAAFDKAQFGTAQFDTGPFTPTERAEFPNSLRLTAGTLVELIGTHSQFLVMAGSERDRLLANIGAYLASRPETAKGPFELPMVTSAMRAVRVGGDSSQEPGAPAPRFARPPYPPVENRRG
jgi:SAM-dependent methyltransferase